METYKRSQVEDSLWTVMRTDQEPVHMPQSFKSKVKKLIDLDRAVPPRGQKAPPLLFSEERPDGHGSEALFSSVNAFLLGLALDLWAVGFKQSDILFLLQHTKSELQNEHRRIMVANVEPYQDMPPIDGWPVVERNEVELADTRIYLVVRTVERHVKLPARQKRQAPELQFRVPQLYRGLAALSRMFEEAPPALRSAIVLELTDLAVRLDRTLRDSKPRRRGRPS